MRLPRTQMTHPVMVNRGWQGRAVHGEGPLPERPVAESRPAFKRLSPPVQPPPPRPRPPESVTVTAPRDGVPVGPVLVSPPPPPDPDA